ncbi:MAG: hypothetical protein EXR76_07735 [Myxococcales bacterium]|nr:hypothetical protein [Myxococcales bacterium]
MQRPFATSIAPGASWEAIGGVWPRHPLGWAHTDFFSDDTADVVKRAGCSLDVPMETRHIRAQFASGYVPTAVRVGIVEATGERFLTAVQLDGDGALTARVDSVISAYFIEQASGGGSEAHPEVLGLTSLCLESNQPGPLRRESNQPGPLRRESNQPDFAVSIEHDAGFISPLSQTFDALELSLARCLRLVPRAGLLTSSITLTFHRLGTSGDALALEELLSEPELATVDGVDVIEVGRSYDISEAGHFAGLSRVVLTFDAPLRLRDLRLKLPRRRDFVLSLSSIHAGGDAAGHVVLPSPETSSSPFARGESPRLETSFLDAGDFSLAAVRALVSPPKVTAALGLSGTDPRVGIDPNGVVSLRREGDHNSVLYLSFGPLPDVRRVVDEAQTCIAVSCGAEPVFEAVIEGATSATPCVLNLETTWSSVALVLRDGLRPRALELTLRLSPSESTSAARLEVIDERGLVVCEVPVGTTLETPDRAGGEWGLRLKPGRVRVPLGPCALPLAPPKSLSRLRVAAAISALPTRADEIDFHLPDPEWDDLARRSLAQVAGFVLADDRVACIDSPAAGHGEVIGLAEGDLFTALAEWGSTTQALTLFRRNTLATSVLDERHEVDDLRNGLMPWQLSRLLQLADLDHRCLTPVERERLLGLEPWLMASRALTASATGQAQPSGTRTFPGLLPAHQRGLLPADQRGLLPAHQRGQDAQSPRQHFTADAANCAGLRELGVIFGVSGFIHEAERYRRALLDAMDAMKLGDDVPLHSGGGEPSDEHQLLVCGLLDSLDFFTPDDGLAAVLDDRLNEQGRLFFELPRFDRGPGSHESVVGHASVGYLLNALHTGDRERFWTGLCGLVAVTMDPEVFTFREVSPIGRAPLRAETFLPGHPATHSEPFIGGPAVALRLLRHALITELPDLDGRSGGVVRVLAGALPSFFDGPMHVTRAPTLAGPVTLRTSPQGDGKIEVFVSAPGARAIEIVDGCNVVSRYTAPTARVVVRSR